MFCIFHSSPLHWNMGRHTKVSGKQLDKHSMMRRQLTRDSKRMAVSFFKSIEVWRQWVSMKLTGVTEVLDLDLIKRSSLHFLKLLDNCKDYFQLCLLICVHCIVLHHHSFWSITCLDETPKFKSIVKTKRSFDDPHALLTTDFWTTIPPIIYFHTDHARLFSFSDPSLIPPCSFHCHLTVRI